LKKEFKESFHKMIGRHGIELRNKIERKVLGLRILSWIRTAKTTAAVDLLNIVRQIMVPLA